MEDNLRVHQYFFFIQDFFRWFLFSNLSIFRNINTFSVSLINESSQLTRTCHVREICKIFVHLRGVIRKSVFLSFLYINWWYFSVRVWFIHLNFVTLRELWSWFLRAGIRYTGWDLLFPCPLKKSVKNWV